MPHRRGTVLVVVLIVVVIAAMVAVGELLRSRSELAAAEAAAQGRQARLTAMSGIHRAMALLMEKPADLAARGDNPTIFQDQRVAGDETTGWCFTVYADNFEQDDAVRYGVEDEAGKININTASESMLLALPGMNQALVDCLLDYRDADSEPRAQGAEQEDYDRLPQPYQIRNGPLATLDELLLVKGFNASIVYGEDANCNGLLDPNENDGDASFPPDDGNGILNRGLRPFATAGTYEPNVSADGKPRININALSGAELSGALTGAGLPPATVEFIVTARKAGVMFPDPSQLLGMTLEVDASLLRNDTPGGNAPTTRPARGNRPGRGNRPASGAGGGRAPEAAPGAGETSNTADQPNYSVTEPPVTGGDAPAVLAQVTPDDPSQPPPGQPRRRRRRPPTNPAQPAPPANPDQPTPPVVTNPQPDNGVTTGERVPQTTGQKVTISSGVNGETLAVVMDRLTTGGIKVGGQDILPGRVNINVAPKGVLLALPGMTEASAGQVLEARRSDGGGRDNIAWLYTQNILTAEVFKQLAPYLTARSYQFRVRSFGYSMASGRFCVMEALIDTASGTPRIAYLRDLTALGVPLKPTVSPR